MNSGSGFSDELISTIFCRNVRCKSKLNFHKSGGGGGFGKEGFGLAPTLPNENPYLPMKTSNEILAIHEKP